ncbi:DNA polymerase IV [Microvirga sp. W0021]|uniref:DNA polymerase IV n=1 Tax=Hohaiivirga grylli TaxID=3133970 RepID=A0ABV0BJ53_9HYPH
MTTASAFFCRDCLTVCKTDEETRCSHCGSPRLLKHQGLETLSIAHIDCDAFYASIEKRDNPEIMNKPVIIGGGKRGVVSTACYLARIRGVRSAMPMFKARQLCPEAVVVPPNIDKYKVVSREIRQMMLELTPLVEPLSIDEAFLDLSGTERLHHGIPALTLAKLARRIENELNLTVSVGLSYNKFLAKVASDLEKPRGFSVITREEAVSFLADKPVGIIYGVGPAAQERLAKIGITKIKQIQLAPLDKLAGAIGNDVLRLLALSRGEDKRRVEPVHEVKSISNETTFETDISSYEELETILWRLSEKVSQRMKHAGFATTSVTLKLKDNKFQTISRVRSGLPPTQLAARIFDVARQILKKECEKPRAYRLIGVGATELCDPTEADQGDLADTTVIKTAQMEGAIDSLRQKFGANAIKKGISLRRS